MILLLDIGNSRTKWGFLTAGELTATGARSHGGGTEILPPDLPHQPEAVYAANVAGERAAEALRTGVAARWNCRLILARSAARAGAVRNAYADPQQLGVDRWLALVGAYASRRAALCLVDAGTATTVDLLARDGRHLGGFIVPGRDLMVDSLLTATGELARRREAADPDAEPAPGQSTGAAMRDGGPARHAGPGRPGAPVPAAHGAGAGDRWGRRAAGAAPGGRLRPGPGAGRAGGKLARWSGGGLMRNLVLLLVLANLLVLAWQRWIVPPPAADPLQLQAQREAELVLIKAEPPSGATPSGAGRACLRVGPFATDEQAAAAAAGLRSQGLSATARTEAGEVWVGHWVQVPDLASRAAAAEARDALVAAGVADAYVVRADGDYKISLGVFRERTRAERVARLARGAGFEVLTTDRTRAGEETWLWLEPGETPDLRALAGPGDQILRSEPAPCTAGPADSGAGANPLESAANAAPE